MSELAPTYRIVSRTHINSWDNARQEAVPGWNVQAVWTSTGTVLPVFVPDTAYTADNVDRLIRAAGAVDEQVHSLGG